MFTIHEKRIELIKYLINKFKLFQPKKKKKNNQSSTYNLIPWGVQAWIVFEIKSKYNHEHLILVYLTRL